MTARKEKARRMLQLFEYALFVIAFFIFIRWVFTIRIRLSCDALIKADYIKGRYVYNFNGQEYKKTPTGESKKDILNHINGNLNWDDTVNIWVNSKKPTLIVIHKNFRLKDFLYPIFSLILVIIGIII